MDAFISTIAKTINSLHVLLEVEKAFKIFFGMTSMTLYRDDFPIHCNFVAFSEFVHFLLYKRFQMAFS